MSSSSRPHAFRRSVLPLAAVLAFSGIVVAPAAGAVTARVPTSPKCMGKKPSYVLTGRNAKLTLTARTKNAVVDLLGKGETLNAGKAKGNTYVCDTGGAKSITTGNGNDKVSIKNGSPSVNTGAGNDSFVQTGTGNPVVHLGVGNDVGRLGKGNGTIYGDAGDDVLAAGSAGHQKLYGGTGHDTLYAGAATSLLDGSDGGTRYVVPGVVAGRTTVVLHPGDTINGKAPVSAPPPPVQVPVPAAPVVVPPVVVPPPPISFDQATVQTSVGLVTDFYPSLTLPSGDTPASWAFDFGDGAPRHAGVGAPPNYQGHSYLAGGSYQISLTVLGSSGRSYVGTEAVQVSTDSTYRFTLPKTTNTKQVTGTFTGTPGSVASFVMSSVDWGDQSQPDVTGGPPTLRHVYAAFGHYLVTVSVSDDHGGSGTSVLPIDVTDDGGAHATLLFGGTETGPLAAGPFYATVGDPVIEDLGRSVAMTGDSITSYQVKPFANASATNVHNADGTDYLSYQYSTMGDEAVSATIGTQKGVGATATSTVYVAGQPASALTLTAASPTVPAGRSVRFSWQQQLGTKPADAPLAESVVSQTITQSSPYGAGSSVSIDPSSTGYLFVSTTPGVETFTLRTVDSYGHAMTSSATVLVTGAKPAAVFSPDPGYAPGDLLDFRFGSPWAGLPPYTGDDTDPRNGQSISPEDFDLAGVASTAGVAAAAGNTATTFSVDFGDGTSPTTGSFGADGLPVPSSTVTANKQLTHSYGQGLAGGEFTVTVTVADASGATTTLQEHISIGGQPQAVFGKATSNGTTLTIPVTSYSAGQGAVGDTTVVTETGSGGAVSTHLVGGNIGSSIVVPDDVGTVSSARVILTNDHAGATGVDASF